jgi:peptidoglycan biosynthesis protein MviN/MurJ (putative lipid II flippase)
MVGLEVIISVTTLLSYFKQNANQCPVLWAKHMTQKPHLTKDDKAVSRMRGD